MSVLPIYPAYLTRYFLEFEFLGLSDSGFSAEGGPDFHQADL
jgi:hypothetical protein